MEFYIVFFMVKFYICHIFLLKEDIVFDIYNALDAGDDCTKLIHQFYVFYLLFYNCLLIISDQFSSHIISILCVTSLL